jgi:hypothetical protein
MGDNIGGSNGCCADAASLSRNFPRAFSAHQFYVPNMLIWILALILFTIAGACAYKLGAVRFGVSFVGLLLAAILARPLGPYLKSLVPLMGLKDPISPIVVPPLIVFLLIYLIFIGLSFFVHRKVELHFKYHADDTHRFRWERANRAMGLWMGLMTGAVWLFLFGLVIYVTGYLTVQVSAEESNSLYMRLLNQARHDMHETGFDRMVAPFDPMPRRYYEASDILGLIYQNPILVGRISQYPPFLLLADRPEFQELAKDTEFNQMLLSKADVTDIIKHPKMQAILQNPEIVQELLSQDLKDFRTYLETGISPKYEEEKILGKWKLDPYATMAQQRKKHPDLSSTEMRQLRRVMMEIMPGVSFMATTDKKATLKADVSEKLKQLFQPPAPKPVAPQAATAPGVPPQMSQRYGRTAAPPRVVVPAPQAAQKPREIPYMVYSAQGSWEHDGSQYQLKVQDEKGKSESLEATADEDRLTINTPHAILVFAKAD